jgi:addiction module RelE/StbE family toxin
MWQLVFTDLAEEDLLGAAGYITEILKAPTAAENLLLEAEREIENLATYPLSHPLVREEHFATKGVRFLRIKNYLLFYTTNKETQVVSVIRFLHARRDWVSLLESGNEED